MKQMLRSRAIYYMEGLDFPADAVADLAAAYDKIAANEACFATLCRLVSAYEQTQSDWHFTPVLEECREMFRQAGIENSVGFLLFYLCLADGLLSHYRARGIDEQIFWGSLADLRYKLIEGRLIFGVNGIYHERWTSGFFKVQLFELGRLQFELTTLQDPYTCAGKALPAGTKAINIHIPRTGKPLFHDEVVAAYARAKDFFAAEFVGVPTVFTCHSWLLDPWNLTVLSAQSNLRAFCADFEIVKVGSYADYSQVWRLFDCNYNGDPDALPQDSSLRRAYAARIKRGEPTGYARGIFLME